MSLAMVNLSKRYRAMSCAPLHFPGLKTRVGSFDENVETPRRTSRLRSRFSERRSAFERGARGTVLDCRSRPT
jgi:hypothetical protein